MKNSIASLKERLTGWLEWDQAAYQVGACLGFWPEFGAPQGHDLWHQAKGVIWSANPLGDGIAHFLEALVVEGCLEKREVPDIAFRWNPDYQGGADIITLLK